MISGFNHMLIKGEGRYDAGSVIVDVSEYSSKISEFLSNGKPLLLSVDIYFNGASIAKGTALCAVSETDRLFSAYMYGFSSFSRRIVLSESELRAEIL